MIPLPSGFFEIFPFPLEISLFLIEVLFTRMSNFVSLMYFMLNSTTDITVKPLCRSLMCSSHEQILWVSCISGFLLNSTTDKQILYLIKSHRIIVKKPLAHTQMKCKIRLENYTCNSTFLSLHQEESNT